MLLVHNFIQKYRKNILVFFICAISLFVVLFSYAWHMKTQRTKMLLLPNKLFLKLQKNFSFKGIAQKASSRFKILTDLNFYSDLPVADVVFNEVPNSWATVVFFPQYHKYPGSEVDDPRNNRAEKVQKETYHVMDKIIEQVPLNIIALEGELDGQLEPGKRTYFAQKLKYFDQLNQSFRNLEKHFHEQPMYPEIEENILTEIKNKLAYLERDLILEGAPVQLWAKYDHIQVFGTENPQTLEESKILVRDYIYLQDRLMAITQPKPYAQIPAFHASFNGSTIESIQQDVSMNYLFDQDFHLLEVQAKEQNPRVWEALQEFKNTWNEATNFQKTGSEDIATMEPQVSRADNPYENIDDVSYLQSLIAENEGKIQETIITRRNREAAQYVAQILQTQEDNLGILQFGAGHEQGLVEELKHLGMSVITVKTFSVMTE